MPEKETISEVSGIRESPPESAVRTAGEEYILTRGGGRRSGEKNVYRITRTALSNRRVQNRRALVVGCSCPKVNQWSSVVWALREPVISSCHSPIFSGSGRHNYSILCTLVVNFRLKKRIP